MKKEKKGPIGMHRGYLCLSYCSLYWVGYFLFLDGLSGRGSSFKTCPCEVVSIYFIEFNLSLFKCLYLSIRDISLLPGSHRFKQGWGGSRIDYTGEIGRRYNALKGVFCINFPFLKIQKSNMNTII